VLIRKLLHICLALIFLLNLFGCATPAAWKSAKEKASVPITYRKIVDIHPTAVREDGNIKICVKLICKSDECKEQYYLVSLPFNSLASGKIKPKKKKLRKEIFSFDPYLPIYSFPIKKPSKECVEIAEMNVSPESQIHIEKLYLPSGEWLSLYDGLSKNKEDIFALLNKNNDVVPPKDTLYSINIKYGQLESARILLSYFPDKDTNSGAHAIGIVGGYKDTSTKAGYALIPFAIIADAVIIAIVIVGALLSGAGGINLE
jgi:hypothetical protein